MEMRNNINISPTHLIYKSTITFIKPTLSSTNLTVDLKNLVVWNVCVSFFHGNITKQATIITWTENTAGFTRILVTGLQNMVSLSGGYAIFKGRRNFLFSIVHSHKRM
jgi:hypothetical protein